MLLDAEREDVGDALGTGELALGGGTVEHIGGLGACLLSLGQRASERRPGVVAQDLASELGLQDLAHDRGVPGSCGCCSAGRPASSLAEDVAAASSTPLGALVCTAGSRR